nr:VWA domain-containing protein [Pseudomonadota bacterium]
MNWGNSDFYYLILLPLLAIFLGKIKSHREARSINRLADPEVLEQISPSNINVIRARNLRYSLLLFSIFSLLILSILRPQWGYSLKETKRRGLDLVVAIDLSESMLAADVSPTRLDRARREVTDLLRSLQGDRISLVSFAGVAFIDSPLTLDYSAFKLFLDNLKTTDIPVQGTNIEAALDKSLEALGLLDKDLNKVSSATVRDRAIVLITDGEELQGNYQNAAKLAKENNVRVYIMGVGTTTGSPITVDNSFKRDKEGKLVLTKLNPEVLKELAYETGGIYIE